jgi:hypothetical protein
MMDSSLPLLDNRGDSYLRRSSEDLTKPDAWRKPENRNSVLQFRTSRRAGGPPRVSTSSEEIFPRVGILLRPTKRPAGQNQAECRWDIRESIAFDVPVSSSPNGFVRPRNFYMSIPQERNS